MLSSQQAQVNETSLSTFLSRGGNKVRANQFGYIKDFSTQAMLRRS
jgi:hypothetical protein